MKITRIFQGLFICVSLIIIAGFRPERIRASTLSNLSFEDIKQNKIVIAQASDPGNSLRRGDSSLKAGKYGDAIKAYTIAVESSLPNDQVYIQARLLRSRAYVEAAIVGSPGYDNYDQAVGAAIADCSRVIVLQPNNPEGYSCRGYAYSNLFSNKEAFADFDRAIELAPAEPKFYFDRGYAYYLRDKHQQAIADFSQSIKLSPDFEAAYYFRALNEIFSNLHNAEEDLTVCIKLNSKEFKYYTERGEVRYKLGEYQRSVDDYTRAIQLRPDLEFYSNRGFSLTALQKYEQALNDFNHAIRLYPRSEGDNGTRYYGRGIVYLKLGKKEEAIRDLKVAIAGFESAQTSPLRPEYLQALDLLKKLRR
jgi:tetratricopeptide (TPR) repeat protein